MRNLVAMGRPEAELVQLSRSYDPRPAKAGRVIQTKLSMASAGLGGRDVAGGDLVFVVGEGC
jgi:hypothetical protein